MLMKAGLEPPGMRDLCEQFGIDEKKLSQVLGFMTRAGRLVKIKEDIYLTDRHEADLKGKVKAFLKQKQVMSPIDMKTVAGVSRKYAIPYMEYLDRIRFTIRVGNERKLFSQN
jgi:selenocysteine-specific elongation factor